MPHPSRRRAVATLVAAVLPALAALVPSPAQAQELRFRDPVGDVMVLDTLAASPRPVVDPTRADGDITAAFVHFRKGRLVVRLDFRSLRPARSELLLVGGDVLTDRRRTYTYTVTTSPGHPEGHDVLTRGVSARAVCRIGHRIDYAHDFARVVVPLGCLGHPHSVRLSFGALAIALPGPVTPQAEDAGLRVFLDAAAPAGGDGFGWTRAVRVPRHGWTA